MAMATSRMAGSAAERILAAWRGAAHPLPALPEMLRPGNLAHVYAIQKAVCRELGAVGGWWICVAEPVAPLACAPVPVATIHPGSIRLAAGGPDLVRAQPVLCLRIGRALPDYDAPFTYRQAIDAIETASLGAETLGPHLERVADTDQLAAIADSCGHAALVHTLVQHGPPPLAQSPVSTCRAHYPGGPVQVHLSAASPDRAAVSILWPGRRPQLIFRGLLRLHARYGPSSRSTAQGGLCRRASTGAVAHPRRLPATGPNRPLPGWDFHPQGDCTLRGAPEDMDYGDLQPAADDYVVIATQHKGDHQSMQRALRSAVRYVALIASRKRSRLVLDYLRAEGFGEDDLARVHAPAGLDLGPRTPEEIALSVLSEIVMLRRGGSGAPARDRLRAEPGLRSAGLSAPARQAALTKS